MKIYAINLTVDTKSTDLYDQVAVNKYPIIALCKDEHDLWEKLSSQDTINWVRSNIRTQHLFNTAYFHIRAIDNNDTIDYCWKADSLIKIVY